jgi:hypothetical protein
MVRRRHRHETSDSTWIIWLVVFFIIVAANNDDDDEKETPKPPAAQQQVFEERMIEGVVQQMIPATDGVTIVIFDDGYQYELHLGDHEVHVGEWNQLRINHEGYVEEVWLGENAIQDVARK